MAKTLTLKTTAGGRFDPIALEEALHSQGPFEPRTEYLITVGVVPAAAETVGAPAAVEPAGPAPENGTDAPPPASTTDAAPGASDAVQTSGTQEGDEQKTE